MRLKSLPYLPLNGLYPRNFNPYYPINPLEGALQMRFKSTKVITALALGTTFLMSGIQAAEARDQIRMVGSSTVYPFTSAAAEQFGKAGKFKTPIVESTGTGGGFKLFCAGVGEGNPDINDASR